MIECAYLFNLTEDIKWIVPLLKIYRQSTAKDCHKDGLR